MSEFEFLPRVTIGQYIGTGSILHRLDARFKLVGFASLLIVLTFTPSKIGLGIGILTLLTLLLISKVNPGYALKGLIPPLPFLAIIALLQILFFTGPGTSATLFAWGPIHISVVSIWAGILIMLRFIALILCLSLASFCISTSEVIHGLQLLFSPLNILKINPMDFVMVIQVMLRFLPFLAQSAERIAKAQASRGADSGSAKKGVVARVRQVVPLIIPLFLTSLRRAENLALAMDARAYGVLPDRTSMQEFRFRWADFIYLVLNTTVSLVILYA
jgi:energy-coupling factor transport system permease protein